MLSTHQLSLNFLVLQHVLVNLYCQLVEPTFFVHAEVNTYISYQQYSILVALLLLVTQNKSHFLLDECVGGVG